MVVKSFFERLAHKLSGLLKTCDFKKQSQKAKLGLVSFCEWNVPLGPADVGDGGTGREAIRRRDDVSNGIISRPFLPCFGQ